MRGKARWALYLFALPWNLTVAWPVVLLVRALWGTDLRWETPPRPRPGNAALVCSLRPDSWPARTWYAPWGGTSLGHGIFYNARHARSGAWSRIQAHEHVHVEQFEVAMLGSAISGAVAAAVLLGLGHPLAAWLTGLGLWWAGYLLMGLSGWTVAYLRGEPAYRGSAHEESAYAQTDE